MKTYQITFVWPNGDWTWTDKEANDWHQVMLIALENCLRECRVQWIERLPEGKSFSPPAAIRARGERRLTP